MKIEIDTLFPKIIIDGKEIHLSRREYDTFLFLWENKGRICTRDLIYTKVWGENHFNNDRATDITIARLRKRLKGTSFENKLITRKYYGYSFVL